tara:strand:+ start:8149 stop:8319 length:171 start_codon:yes stop_codon:yes gene_type:complete
MKHFICDVCDGDFRLKTEMNEDYYEVHFCPFCGAQINKEEDDEEQDELGGFPTVEM